MKFTILGKNVWGSAPALLYFVTHASIFYLSACPFLLRRPAVGLVPHTARFTSYVRTNGSPIPVNFLFHNYQAAHITSDGESKYSTMQLSRRPSHLKY